jgi:subtilase family serine protease
MPSFSPRGLLLSAICAATATSLAHAAPLITAPVDDAATIPLSRDLPGALAASRDTGVLDGATALPHIRLALKRPPALQAAFDALTHDQYTRGSARYHQWLKPADLRAYGPAQEDIAKVTAWLTRQGLHVNSISPSGMTIDFAGTAGRVSAAFHTALHNVTRGTEAHVANIGAPSIPAALAPVVTGVTLANFFPKPAMHRVVPADTLTIPQGTFYAVTPSDFATIYNVTPLRGSTNAYGAPITGAGVTVALVEQTLIKPADFNTFRNVFGLGAYSGTLSLIHPGCTSPGFTPDEGEAALDAEWSTAVAPDASIVEASCAGTAPFEFGVLTSLQNLVENGTTATIFSISYEGDEIENGFSFEQTWNNLVQEGASEGIAIFVASGDNGVSADRNAIDSNGLFVNGLADTAYNVSVGGTDFYDGAKNDYATYWKSKNGKYFSSALSYVPEIPWDNSCASSILWKFVGAPSAIALCNSTFANVQNGVGGSGSQSVYYTKPDWQLLTVPGMPNDGVRDQPDVSLFAANGIWGHFYLFCMSDAKEGGVPCDYHNANDILGSAAGGTSFASPAFAGIAALIQEVAGAKLGNMAPEFYTIAQAQYTTPLGLNQCNASLGNKISPACVFNDVTAGNNAEPCFAGTPNCATDRGATMGIGVLKTTVDGTDLSAYPAQSGYSLATGLGSVNVTNLLYSYY